MAKGWNQQIVQIQCSVWCQIQSKAMMNFITLASLSVLLHWNSTNTGVKRLTLQKKKKLSCPVMVSRRKSSLTELIVGPFPLLLASTVFFKNEFDADSL